MFRLYTDISVIGAGGYIGSVISACLADEGFSVMGYDIDTTRILLLESGKRVFREED